MLKLINVTKSFGKGSKPILDNINLEIQDKEFCVILGSNGSGKTTLFKAISGEHKLDSGQIVLDVIDITKMPLHQRAKYMSAVCQDIGVSTIEEMTLLENIALSQVRTHGPKAKMYKANEQNIIEIIKLLDLGLEDFIHQKLSSFSGGQRQAIAALMAIFPTPNLLMLDEHTSALDPKSKKMLMEFTNRSIQQDGIKTLMITHSIDDAMSYGSRLIIMHSGKIQYDFNKHEKSKLTNDAVIKIFNQLGEII